MSLQPLKETQLIMTRKQKPSPSLKWIHFQLSATRLTIAWHKIYTETTASNTTQLKVVD